MQWTTAQPVPWRIHPMSDRARTPLRIAPVPQETAENDAFLWSLADLMTLLLIFFIMLYSNTLSQSRGAADTGDPKILQEMAAELETEGVFAERADRMAVLKMEGGALPMRQEGPETTAESEGDAAPEAELGRQMVADLEDGFSRDFYVRWEDRQPVIVLGERITFNVGQAALLADARDALERVARMISRIGNCRVVVSGHTDDLPIRTRAFPSNWELSAARAASVAKALSANGVPARRLIIQGQSEFKPLVANTTDENRRTNRRVEISLITGDS